jgi:hypothetical protein
MSKTDLDKPPSPHTLISNAPSSPRAAYFLPFRPCPLPSLMATLPPRANRPRPFSSSWCAISPVVAPTPPSSSIFVDCPPGTHANLVELPPKRGHAPPTTDGIPVADRLAFATRASLWSPSTPLLRSEAIEAPWQLQTLTLTVASPNRWQPITQSLELEPPRWSKTVARRQH